MLPKTPNTASESSFESLVVTVKWNHPFHESDDVVVTVTEVCTVDGLDFGFFGSEYCYFQQDQEWGVFAVAGAELDLFFFAEKTLFFVCSTYIYAELTGVGLLVLCWYWMGNGFGLKITKQDWIPTKKNQSPHTSWMWPHRAGIHRLPVEANAKQCCHFSWFAADPSRIFSLLAVQFSI